MLPGVQSAVVFESGINPMVQQLRTQGARCALWGQEHFAPTVSRVFVFKNALISLPLTISFI